MVTSRVDCLPKLRGSHPSLLLKVSVDCPCLEVVGDQTGLGRVSKDRQVDQCHLLTEAFPVPVSVSMIRTCWVGTGPRGTVGS